MEGQRQLESRQGEPQQELAPGGTIRMELEPNAPQQEVAPGDELSSSEVAPAPDDAAATPQRLPMPSGLPRPGMLRTASASRRVPDFRSPSAAPSLPASSGQVPRGVVPGLAPEPVAPSDTLTFIDVVTADLVASASPTAKPSTQVPPPAIAPRSTRRRKAEAAANRRSIARWAGMMSLGVCGLLVAFNFVGQLRTPPAKDLRDGAEPTGVQAAAHAAASQKPAPTAVATIVTPKRAAEAPSPAPPSPALEVAAAEAAAALQKPEPTLEAAPAPASSAGRRESPASKAKPAPKPDLKQSRSRRAEPAPTPKASPEPRSDTPSATELLRDAKRALAKGQHGQAYKLAKQSRKLSATNESARVMTLAACSMGNKAVAKSAFKSLDWSDRGGLRSECRNRGMNLGL